MRFFLLCLAPLLSAQDFAGEYVARVPEVASGLLLRPDHTYEYYFSYGAADYVSKGTWRSEANAVYLTSSAPDKPAITLAKAAPGRPAAVRVWILAPNGAGVPHVDVILATPAGDVSARTDQQGLADLPAAPQAKSVSVRIPVYDVHAGPFPLEPGKRELYLTIDPEAITHLRFRNERLALAGDALELTYFKGPQPLRYRRARSRQ
ncbi:MAG: hypothetical protein SFV54_16300 [Bryobacteraceae bacterium]|nr:hypothetical protein [Bryobacteraceae bacterium]